MNEEELNMQIRRFLKKVGIQSQREIEQAILNAVENGSAKTGDSFPATMTLNIAGLDLKLEISGEIAIGE
ncbi:MAG: hypothetical protein ACI8P9_002878 [Parasphingorhabdus sp.]|jgi:hypothetical protein